MDDIKDMFDSLQQRVSRLEQVIATAYYAVDPSDILLEEMNRETPYDRELRALRANGKWRTPEQEARFQELTQQQLHSKSVLVKVLNEHEGKPWNTIGEPKWGCNCAWEGDDHAEHVADMYEAELRAQSHG